MIMIVYTLGLIFIQYVYYLCGTDKKTCTFTFLKQMAAINTLYVKVLQSISNRNNFLTDEQKLQLFEYTDNVPYTFDDIDNNFKKNLCNENIILENNGQPIRAGCIALIYKAKLNNKPVVIKIARKNISKKIESSLHQLKYIVKFIMFFTKDLSIDINELLNEHKKLFLDQVNFINELHNLEKVYNNFKNIDNVVIPKPYPQFTKNCNNMIVMDYIEGKTIREIHDDDKDKYIEIILKFFLKSWMYDCFYHADFHPGNIIFLKNNDCKIAVIDYGLMCELNDYEQEGLQHFVQIMHKSDDYYESTRKFTNNIIIPKNIFHSLSKDIQKDVCLNISMIVKNGFERSFLNAEDLNNMNNILKNYKLKVEPSTCKLILAFTILDSVIHNIKANANYIDLVKKYAQSMFLTDLIDLIDM